MTYTVFASDADEVQKKLDRLGKKAQKYGVSFTYTRGEEHPQRVCIYEPDPPYYNTKSIVSTYTVAAVDFDVQSDGWIKSSGWEAIAMIEHGEGGNIVTQFGDEMDSKWFSVPPHCDHCNTNRNRSVTFIVRHENGATKQVGKACLKEYTGINPSSAILWAEITRDLECRWDYSEDEWELVKRPTMQQTVNVIALAYDAIKRWGWVSRNNRDCTADRVGVAIMNHVAPSAEGLEKAHEIVGWLLDCGHRALERDREIDELQRKMYAEDEFGQTYVADKEAQKALFAINNAWDRVGDIERDCYPLANSGWCKPAHYGRLAYMPVAYSKYLERKARYEAREAERLSAMKSSAHVGEIGQRITFTATKAQLVTSWETQYGYTYLYKFTDEDGNVFVWFASGCYGEIKDGSKVKGTVKDHTERDGVKQTVLSRCKIG